MPRSRIDPVKQAVADGAKDFFRQHKALGISEPHHYIITDGDSPLRMLVKVNVEGCEDRYFEIQVRETM